jgi:hypothetical protein
MREQGETTPRCESDAMGSDNTVVNDAVAAATPPVRARPSSASETWTAVSWRIFGSTLICVAAIIAVALWVKYTNNIDSVRDDVKELRVQGADLIRKDDYHARQMSVAVGVKEVQTKNATAHDYWRLKALAQERQLKALRDESNSTIKDLERQVQQLQERLAALEKRPPSAPSSKSKK